jgi:large subunit ribosomal protein L23
MKLTAHDVIRQPLVTEKSTRAREALSSVYCFRADARANKVQIAAAVEELFGVKVADVRTANVSGKTKRAGRYLGRKPDWKKAWVRLAPGEKEIELFEAS